MSTIRYRDSERTLNNSGEDYLTLSNYNDSFYNMTKTSQLRMAIVPGTVKYFNKAFSVDALQNPDLPSRYNTDNVPSESALTLLPSRANVYDDQCDYASYPKLSNN